MGIVPPSIAPWMREETTGYQPLPCKAAKQEAQPKDERPPLQGYGDQLEGYSGERQGGQSNTALLALMKSIEEHDALNAEIQQAEKRAQVIRMLQAGLEYSEIYMKPVALLAEEENVFPLGRSGAQPYRHPAPSVDHRLIGEDQR